VTTLTAQAQTLSAALNELSDKLGNMPRAAEFGAMAARIDRNDAAVAELRDLATGLRHDVDNLRYPSGFRSPR
jgi:hypothetical protein